MIHYRHLPAEEWPRLEPVYRSQADVLPCAEHNTAIVAEADGRIIGMCGVNLVAHVGPLWVDEEFRRRQIGQALAKAAGELVRELGGKGYLMFPSNPSSAKIAEKLGLEPMNWLVYGRTF